MYAYILLAAVLGTAIAAPTSPTTKSDQKLEQQPAALLQKNPSLQEAILYLEEPQSAAKPEWLKESAPAASGSALAPPTKGSGLAPALLAPAASPALAVTPLKAGVPSPKALSLISEIRSPQLIAPVITPIAATPLLSTRQVSPFIYTAPALASVELAAAPSSYSIEQHGYRITY